jgi:tetratricopeptide (TPR) repeat protein
MKLILILCLTSVAGADWTTLQEAGKQAYAQGNFAEADRQFAKALVEAADEVQRLNTLGNLAAARTQLRRFGEADEIFESLEPYRILAASNPKVAEGLIQADINHAALTLRRGDPARARIEFEALLHRSQNDSTTAQICNHLALLDLDSGRFQQAQQYAERALAIRERLHGPDALETATTLSILSQTIQAQGDYAGAEALCRRSLAIRQKNGGTGRTDFAESLSNLGTILKAGGNYAEAEKLYRQAQLVWARISGAQSFGVALALNNLAALHQVQGKFKLSEEEFTQSMRSMERAAGQEHPAFASILANFAALYREWHKFDKAETLLRRSLSIDEQRLGPVHQHVALDLASLADVAGSRHDYAAAEPLLRRALSIYELTAGRDSAIAARSAFRLAVLYQLWAKAKDAAPFYQQALMYWQVKGQADLQVASSLESYAVLLKRNQLFAEAEAARTIAMGIRVQAAKSGIVNAFPKS